jgi:hypothetical protein
MTQLASKIAVFALSAVTLSAGTWTGTISDSMCGATHKKMEEHGNAKISDRDCTLACVKNGGKYVFVSKGKVYQVTNQDYAGLQQHAGHTVKLTGDLSGNNITVTGIEMSGKGSEKKKSSD